MQMKNKSINRIRGDIKHMAFYAEFLLFPFIFTIVVYLCVRILAYKNRTLQYLLIDILFILYVFIAINLLYFPLYIDFNNTAIVSFHMNLIPFKNIIDSKGSFGTFSYTIGNMLLFVPLAFYQSVRFSQKPKRGLIILIIASVSGELLQILLMYITRTNYRVFDIDDLILNTLGSIIAWFVIKKYLGVSKRKKAVLSEINDMRH